MPYQRRHNAQDKVPRSHVLRIQFRREKCQIWPSETAVLHWREGDHEVVADVGEELLGNLVRNQGLDFRVLVLDLK
jgi:hypothetical protein